MSEYIFFNGSRVKNIAGNIYGDMKVKEVCGIKNRYALWITECVNCGFTKEISAKRINKDSCFHCPECNLPKHKINPPMETKKRVVIKPEDVIGKDFGFWHVEGLADKKGKSGEILYLCKCKCGTLRNIRTEYLVKGRTNSCGCTKKVDIKREKFGRLTALEPVGSKKGKGVVWLCECKCGNHIKATCSELLAGDIRSCGCAGKIEKEQHTKIVWADNGGQKLRSDNTSGVRGVHKANGKWCARIRFKHKSYWLGAYDTKEEAAEARRIAEENMYGDFLQWYMETYSGKLPTT